MKSVQLSLVALLLYTAGIDAKAYKKNVPTYEIGPGATVNGNTITYDDPDCDDGLDCKTTKTCSKAGYTPSLSEDKKYFACCAAGQRLLGSPDTAFDCCADGHDLVGDSDSGYHCCPTGFTFDGQQCKELCKNGKALVDGKCVCPEGTIEGPDGTCKKPDKPGHCDGGECSSGLESGKCYVFKADNGNRLGLAGDNVYYAAPESMTQRYGKFQLCLDEKCAPGKPINPSTEIFIRDTYGDLATGANKNQWLIHAINGGHIGRTPIFSTAGHFSISKWPCGKYCLGGFTEGVGPACPAVTPALTFYTQDPQMCVEFEFTEVPCDLKSDANNCIWKSGDQCCNKVDCSKANCSSKGK
ncbi:cystein rich protein [Xylaria telfairii]|nr:cystein rich protein [Xylaria telfairii]